MGMREGGHIGSSGRAMNVEGGRGSVVSVASGKQTKKRAGPKASL